MIYLFLASVLWGTSFVAGKYAITVASPEIIVLFRMFIAALCVSHIAFKYLKQLPKITLLKIAGLGFLTFPATFLLQFIGLDYTTASNAATMIGFETLLVIISGHLFFNEKADLKQLLLGIVTFIGILLVMGMPNLQDNNFIGCAFVLASTFIVAIWVHLSKKVMREIPTQAYTPLTVLFGFLLTIPSVYLLADDWSINPSISGISAIIYLGIGCSFGAGWAWNMGLARTNPNLSGVFLALEPVYGVLLGILLLGDRPDWSSALGIFLVLSSVLYAVWLSMQEKKERL